MVSWFLIRRDSSGQPLALGMDGSQERQRLVGPNKTNLLNFLQRFSGARGFLVAAPDGGDGIEASSLLPQSGSGFSGTSATVVPDATWFNFFRDSERRQPIVVAMKGSQGVEFYDGNLKAELIEFLLRHTRAGNYLVAPAGATPPSNLPRWQPQSFSNRSWRVLLEVGHGPGIPFDSGALSHDGSTTEYDLNRIAANAARQFLVSRGVDCRVNDDDQGETVQDLINLGARIAGGFDVFCSIHHNASNSRSAQGTEAFAHRARGNSSDRALSSLISAEIARELRIRDRGLKEANLLILSGAKQTNVRAATLAEIYFIDVQSPRPPLRDFSTRGGIALGRAILMWLQRNP